MSEAGLVFQQMSKVAAEVVSVAKQSSRGVSYQFRSIDAVMNALHGPLTKHGLFLSPRVMDDWRTELIPGTKDRQQTQVTFRVCVDVYAEDGSSVTLGPGMAQAQDYGDKAAYQAQQNAIKYLLIEAFSIPTDEPDMDGRQPDEIPAGQGGSAPSSPTRPASTSDDGPPPCARCGGDLTWPEATKEDGEVVHRDGCPGGGGGSDDVPF